MSKTIDQWLLLAKQRHRYIFFFEDMVLDLTDFISLHPGGKKALVNYISKDITDILFKVFPHKREVVLPILSKYNLGSISNKIEKQNILNKSNRNNKSKQKKKVRFNKKFIYKDHQGCHTDDFQITYKKSQRNSKKKSSKLSESNSVEKSETGCKDKKFSKQIEQPSIKLIEQKAFKDDYSYKQLKQKQASRQNDISSIILQQQFDEEKPIFCVKIFRTKHMNQL